MKTNEKKELQQKNIAELKKSLEDSRKEIITAKLDHARGKLKNPRSIRALRRNIAQIMTVIHGKELANGKNS